MKKLSLVLVLTALALSSKIEAGGGAVAGGILGGLALGGIIAAAASQPREVVYVNDPYYYGTYGYAPYEDPYNYHYGPYYDPYTWDDPAWGYPRANGPLRQRAYGSPKPNKREYDSSWHGGNYYSQESIAKRRYPNKNQ